MSSPSNYRGGLFPCIPEALFHHIQKVGMQVGTANLKKLKKWKPAWRCPRGKSILTPCWNGFFDLLSVAFVIIITHNGLPQRILPLCLTIKLKCLCSEPCPPVDGRKEKTNTSLCLRLAILGDIRKINGIFFFFTLFPHRPPSLIHKRTWHPDPNQMVIFRH